MPDEKYCTECGSEDLKYLDTYANGDEYKCRQCGQKTIWPKDKDDE